LSVAILWAGSLPLSESASAAPPRGTATIYPPPAGEAPSPRYDVRITDRTGIARQSFVYVDRARHEQVPDNHGTDLQKGRTFSWTTFETDGPVEVQVIRREGRFKSVKLRPSRYGLSPVRLSNDTVEFIAAPGQKISVEFDEDLDKCYFDNVECVQHILMVFADPKTPESPVTGISEEDIFRPRPGTYAETAKILNASAPVVSTMGNAGGKKAVVFGPGVYTIGYWQVPNNVEHIHLEGGAIVYGAIDVLPLGAPPDIDDYLKSQTLTLRHDFKLTGHGILSGRKIPWHMTKDFKYCGDGCWWKNASLVQLAAENITVKDITLADSPYFNLTFANGADPRTTGVLDGFKVVAQWAYNNDGVKTPARGRIENCFIQANDDAIVLSNSGATIRNCTLWQFGNGASFQLGWYNKSVSGIEVSAIDVIHAETWWGPGDNSGLLNFAKTNAPAVRPAEIRDIRFNNIVLEDRNLRLVGLTAEFGQKIRDLRFANVSIGSWRHAGESLERANYLNTATGGSIEGIVFDNLRIGRDFLTTSNVDWVGRFQVTGDVSDIVFSGPNP